MLCDGELNLRQPLSARVYYIVYMIYTYMFAYVYLPMHVHVLHDVTYTRALLLRVAGTTRFAGINAGISRCVRIQNPR